MGASRPTGYGLFRVGSNLTNDRRLVGAHRVAFELTHGYLPQVVRHSCDNPGCVNPAHLEGGTYADNSRDMVERGRSTRGRAGAAGARNGAARLDENTVQWIRASKLPSNTVAEWAGVSRTHVNRLRRGANWKHV